MLVGLNGRKGSGKNVVGDYLVVAHGFTAVSFAAKLKESAAALFGISTELWDDLKNEPDVVISLDTDGLGKVRMTARKFLQRYGTEAHRDVFGTSFWRDALYADLPSELGADSSERYVITDARFDDELQSIRDRGGINWRVLRDVDSEPDPHVSEAEPGYGLIDSYLDNDGSFKELFAQVDTLIGRSTK